jgi:hypothetical protein
MKEQQDQDSEKVSKEDHDTTIKAYDAKDNYNEMVSGHSSIDEFSTRHEQCSICNLVATNKHELEDHMLHAHGSQK